MIGYKDMYNWQAAIGKDLAYDLTGADGFTTRSPYAVTDAGMINGENAIKVHTSMSVGGMDFASNYYYSKTDSACLKAENVDGSQVTAASCDSFALTPQNRQSLRIDTVGTEQVSVPAYSGPATKYRITVSNGGRQIEHFAWVAQGYSIPVKIYDPALETTYALAQYPG